MYCIACACLLFNILIFNYLIIDLCSWFIYYIVYCILLLYIIILISICICVYIMLINNGNIYSCYLMILVSLLVYNYNTYSI